MKVRLNGQTREIRAGITVGELLEELNLAGKRVAVAVNGSVTPRAGLPQRQLVEGDEIEVIQAVAGG